MMAVRDKDDKRIPKPVKTVAKAIYRKENVPWQSAIAMAIGRLRELGYVEKEGVDLTEEGKRKLSKHYKKRMK